MELLVLSQIVKVLYHAAPGILGHHPAIPWVGFEIKCVSAHSESIAEIGTEKKSCICY